MNDKRRRFSFRQIVGLLPRLLWRLMQLRAQFYRWLSPGVVIAGMLTLASLAAVWNLPLGGCLAAMLSLVILAMTLNRFFAPHVHFAANLPSILRVGVAAEGTIAITNQGSLPAFDLRFEIDSAGSRFTRAAAAERGGRRRIGSALFEMQIDAQRAARLLPGQRLEVGVRLCCHVRGAHQTPPLVVVSQFPMALFNARTWGRSDSPLLVAPQPLDSIPGSLQRLGRRIGRRGVGAQGVGDTLHYRGNREYQPGINVRRWDYASWARLGRPIVREFEPPAVSRIALVIDSFDDSNCVDRSTFEWLMRYTMTAAQQIAETSRVRMRVSGFELDTENLPPLRDVSPINRVSAVLALARRPQRWFRGERPDGNSESSSRHHASRWWDHIRPEIPTDARIVFIQSARSAADPFGIARRTILRQSHPSAIVVFARQDGTGEIQTPTLSNDEITMSGADI